MTVRAVSLDLWFTAYLRTATLAARWADARREALVSLIRGPEGGASGARAVLGADRRVQRRLREAELDPDLLAPSAYLELVVREAGGKLHGKRNELEERYALAGFAANPPVMNPELPALRSELRRRGVRLVFLTNSHRPAAPLQRFFASRGELLADAVFTSCEAGVRKPSPGIFLHAASQLGLAPQEILHVGDRIDSDVLGAWAVGMRSALYTGYWSVYPPGSEEAKARKIPSTALPAGVPRVEALSRIPGLLTDPEGRPGPRGARR